MIVDEILIGSGVVILSWFRTYIPPLLMYSIHTTATRTAAVPQLQSVHACNISKFNSK